MRRMGWIVAVTMLLYPLDYFLAKREFERMIAAERAARAARQPEPATSGMQFDLRTPVHCGPIGWAGSWAFLIGSVWVLVAGGLWLYYRLTTRHLGASSGRAFLVTATAVAIVLAFMLIEAYG
jgi:hypothetical protein